MLYGGFEQILGEYPIKSSCIIAQMEVELNWIIDLIQNCIKLHEYQKF